MNTITREPVTHNLKIWPEYFASVRDGLKRAELRWNDREYQAGDILDLCEWDPNEEAFTGDFISVTVTHVAELGQWMPGYVLLSVAPPAPENAEPVAWLWSHRKHPSEVTLVRPEDDERAEGAHWSGLSCQALYASPPAPVSIDERAAFNAWNNDTDCPLAGLDAKTAAWLAWSRRAAMLQGAEPVTTAYKLPDGWVACSERMPEEDGNYWGWWSESKRQGPVWFIKSELQAQFQSSEITHWMPLPAAPQQEFK